MICGGSGGEEVLKKWQKEQENLIYCFMEHFDFDEIQVGLIWAYMS